MFTKPLHAIDFYIFRHGDTYNTKHKIPYKDKVVSAPIIPEANVYLEKIGQFLLDKNIEFAATSDFLRCQQTAKIVGEKMNRDFLVDKRLNEYDPINLPGETEEHFKNRIKSFLLEISNKNYSSVAICTHGSGISLLKHFLTNSNSLWNCLDYPPPGVLAYIKNAKEKIYDFR